MSACIVGGSLGLLPAPGHRTDHGWGRATGSETSARPGRCLSDRRLLELGLSARRHSPGDEAAPVIPFLGTFEPTPLWSLPLDRISPAWPPRSPRLPCSTCLCQPNSLHSPSCTQASEYFWRKLQHAGCYRCELMASPGALQMAKGCFSVSCMKNLSLLPPVTFQPCFSALALPFKRKREKQMRSEANPSMPLTRSRTDLIVCPPGDCVPVKEAGGK